MASGSARYVMHGVLFFRDVLFHERARGFLYAPPRCDVRNG